MLQKLKTKQESGFTIIEVMIVLAIAGLILLIVFLAVPALQRNAHNTSIKNDVSSILGAANTYTNNNNGAVLPTEASIISGQNVQIGSSCGGGGAADNCAKGKVGYVTAGSITSASSATMPAKPGTVVVAVGATCNDTGTGLTTTGATTRQYVALYVLEGGAKECTAS